VVLAILAVATLGGVFALDRLGFGIYSLGAIVVTGVLAVAYLWEYSRRLESEAPPFEEVEDEPFDDPVEEALRPPEVPSPVPSPDPGPVPAVPTAPSAEPPAEERDDGLE
jgi:hypothetical protein